MANEVIVKAEALSKTFGPLEVLKDITFEIRAGEHVCVWGPSGAGKSTLLHVVGLMAKPSAGKLTLFGRDAAALSDRAQAAVRNEKIGFLFQFHHLLPDLTLLENVMIPLLLRRKPGPEAREKAAALLTRLGLGQRLDHRPSETSGGEQQRAALARALSGGPSLLLADEPTGNLDRGIGREVEALLQEETRTRGTALVIVTHDEKLAAQADRRLVLMDGKWQP